MTDASRSLAVALVVAGALFMENLDATVVVTAVPAMASSFGVHPVDLNVGVSAYLLTLAVLIPASGWAADRIGPRPVFAAAIVVFTLASVLCALSPNLPCFVAARVLQGAGGAMMAPVGRLVVLRATAKHDLMRAVATITWPGLAAPVLGPPVGGFITTHASWPWIFLINVPLGIVGLLAALRLLPKGLATTPRPFDWPGFALTGAACLALMYGVELLSRQGEPALPAMLCLVGAIGLGLLARRHAHRAPHSLIDLWAFRLRTYAVVIAGGSLSRVSIGAMPFLLPLLFQVGFGLDAFRSGLLVLAVFAGNLGMKPLTSPVLRRWTFRTALTGTGLVSAASIAACAFLTPATPIAVVAPILFVSGLARSMQFTCLHALAFADVPEHRMSGANTLINMAQQMSMGLGVAVAAVILRIAEVVSPDASGGISLGHFRTVFLVVAVIGLVSLLDLRRLPENAGDDVRLRRAVPEPKPRRTGDLQGAAGSSAS